MTYRNHLHAISRGALEREAALRNRSLTSLNRGVADSLFSAAELALQDHEAGNRVYRVVSAPTGSGKSSSARALIRGLLDALSNSSVVFLCESIDQCDVTYRELAELLCDYPEGTVGVWTKAHDAATSRQRALADYSLEPAHHQTRDELRNQRVIVATHALYKSAGGAVTRHYRDEPRTLTIIDEKPQEVDLYDVSTGDVKAARDALAEQLGSSHEAVRHLDQLHCYLEARWRDEEARTAFEPLFGEGMSFFNPDDTTASSNGAAWFASPEALEIFRATPDGPVQAAFGFGLALSRGCAFLCRYDRSGGRGCRFLGYDMNMPIYPGTVMLDATADIDGISQILDSRALVDTPVVSYQNLEITHVQPCPSVVGPRERISEIVKTASRAEPYADWIKASIVANTEPGERILAVVHKALLDHRYLPDTAKRWDAAMQLPEDREACFINWGAGIGANHWREATAVFLFGEFHVPKRATVGTVLGLTQQQADSGYLNKVQSPSCPEWMFQSVLVGHLARWEKQLALRGNARNIDEKGVCGRQKLIVTGEFKRLASLKEKLFPGAKLTQSTASKTTARQGGEAALVSLLRDSQYDVLSSQDIRELTGIQMRKKKAWYLSRPGVIQAMQDEGWHYVKGKSRTHPSRFVRQELLNPK